MEEILKGKHLVIDLGSGNPDEGEIQPEGYILQDVKAHKGIQLVCDIEDLGKHIKPGQCKKLRMSHVLEHFPTAKTVPLLKMLHALLEEDGELEVHVPNFRWHASLLLQDQDEDAVKYAFGGQRDEHDFHKTAFTPALIYKALTEAGFKISDVVVEKSIHVLAKKNGEPKS